MLYVVYLKRYKEFRVVSFYILAVLIVGLRISEHAFLIWMNRNDGGQDGDIDFDFWILSYTCRQFENILGIQQLASMVDLCLMVEYQGKLRLQKTRRQRMEDVFADNFDETRHRKYVARVSYCSRIMGFALSGALIVSVIVVFADN